MVRCEFCNHEYLKVLPGTNVRRDVYEDENTLCILDREPISPGHILVILKEHRRDIATITHVEMCSIIPALMECCSQQKNQLDGIEKVYVVSMCENGESPTEHLHFHLIPRYETDESRGFTFLYEKWENRRIWQMGTDMISGNNQTIEEIKKVRRRLLVK